MARTKIDEDTSIRDNRSPSTFQVAQMNNLWGAEAPAAVFCMARVGLMSQGFALDKIAS